MFISMLISLVTLHRLCKTHFKQSTLCNKHRTLCRSCSRHHIYQLLLLHDTSQVPHTLAACCLFDVKYTLLIANLLAISTTPRPLCFPSSLSSKEPRSIYFSHFWKTTIVNVFCLSADPTTSHVGPLKNKQ